jgi:hypothetical protein
MACEKLTKAHLCGQGVPQVNLQSSHAYTAKNLPIIIRQQAIAAKARPPQLKAIVRTAKHLAQEIELLAPSVTRDQMRRDNCEYPWEDAKGNIHLPCDWTFETTNLLATPGGRTFIKSLKLAIAAWTS